MLQCCNCLLVLLSGNRKRGERENCSNRTPNWSPASWRLAPVPSASSWSLGPCSKFRPETGSKGTRGQTAQLNGTSAAPPRELLAIARPGLALGRQLHGTCTFAK